MIKALLVDDEMWIIKGLLRKVRWDKFFIEIVGTATDGIEACNLAIKLKPEIIVTDIRMPGMDGLELIEKLNHKLPGSLFIILSGYDDFHYVQKALRVGAFDYILKPLDDKAFEDILVRAVRKLKTAHGSEAGIEKIEEIIEESISNSKINSILEYINDNCQTEVSLNVVADVFDMSPSYLSTAFKKHVGKNFSDYVAEMKIEKAKQLLLYTDYKVNIICNKVGFSDYRQFVRTFKRIENKTPLQFKREIAEDV